MREVLQHLPNNMTTGDKIRFFRKEKGFTQAYVSHKAGVHAVTLVKYENNKMKPHFTKLKKIAKVLEVSVYALTETDDAPELPSDIAWNKSESIGILLHLVKQGIMQITGERNSDGVLIAETVCFNFTNCFSVLFAKPNDSIYPYQLYDTDLLGYILHWEHAIYLTKLAYERYLKSDSHADLIAFKQAKEYQDLAQVKCCFVSHHE